VGIDRGVTVSAALSTGEVLTVPGLTAREQAWLRVLQRRLARARRGSSQRGKAPGRVEKVPAAYTSQRCSACGHVDRDSRQSQARFRCTACGYAANADVNAARNIAAGHAVKARGGDRDTGPVNREPQLALLSA
jgi:transposase